MSYTALPTALIGAKKAIVDTLWSLIKSNFEDHQDRINDLEGLSAAPVGTMVDYSGAAAPSGWLLCDGSVVAQADYPSLYARIGTTFDTGGEGAGNFRLPDPRGRCAVGKGTGTGLTARTLAQAIGTEGHVVATSEIPGHTHTLTDPGHTHTFPNVSGANTTTGVPQSTTATSTIDPGSTTNTTGITIASAGGGGSHNNMQPSIAAHRIIKT